MLRGVEDGRGFPACFLVDLFGGGLFGIEAGDDPLLERRVLLFRRTVVGFEACFQLAFAALELSLVGLGRRLGFGLRLLFVLIEPDLNGFQA